MTFTYIDQLCKRDDQKKIKKCSSGTRFLLVLFFSHSDLDFPRLVLSSTYSENFRVVFWVHSNRMIHTNDEFRNLTQKHIATRWNNGAKTLFTIFIFYFRFVWRKDIQTISKICQVMINKLASGFVHKFRIDRINISVHT